MAQPRGPTAKAAHTCARTKKEKTRPRRVFSFSTLHYCLHPHHAVEEVEC